MIHIAVFVLKVIATILLFAIAILSIVNSVILWNIDIVVNTFNDNMDHIWGEDNWGW